MASGKQRKRKHDQADYEQPERRAAGNSVREFDDGVEARRVRQPYSIAKRPLIAAAGARACRPDSRAPEYDSNRERQNRPSVRGKGFCAVMN